jgi:2',3'-cyclic-nucleotide 2'-phosphodiesterase/3'-nucleotidase
VRLLHTNDFHGAILPGGRERSTGRPWGGSAVLAAYIDSLRAENPEGTVLLDGGDLFQGTMISNLQFGRPVVEQMDALAYAATAIGNHEFDWTVDTLVRRIHELSCKALGANIVERKSRRRPSWAGVDTTVTRRGVKVAIVGFAYPETPMVTLPQNVAHLDFLPVAPIANRRIPALRRDGASAVVILGHLPAEVDSAGHVGGDVAALAREIKGEDAILGGHSHLRAVGRVDGTPVVVAGSHGQYVSLTDLVVDPVRRTVVESDFRVVPTYADALAPDSAMAARAEGWNGAVAAIASRAVGRSERALLREKEGESTVGNLVADVMRRAVHADFALQNSGGLRANLPAGEITEGHLYEVMPFDNTIVVVALSGAQVEQTIEDALAHDLITQVSGLRYRFDLSRAPGDRVIEITTEGGQPLRPDADYQVACNNFMAAGGDYHATLKAARNPRDTGILVRDALREEVARLTREGKPLTAQLEGRVKRGL